MASKRKTVVQTAKSTRKRTFSLTPAQFRYRWVKALESGKYKQGQKSLHKVENGEHKFCCLGVACDLYKKLGGNLSVRKIDNEIGYGPEQDTSYLPQKVQDALGLQTYDGDSKEVSLTTMNDSGATFVEIAAVIRSKPEGLIAS